MFYSPSRNTCLPAALRADYETHGTWPADAVEIPDELYAEVVTNRPPDKIMVAGPDGNPIVADPPPPTAAEITADLTAAVQSHMDTAARAAGYDDIKSAVTYADEPAVPRFQAEGQAFRAWRSLCWNACYTIMADVQSGARSIPTATELIAELPALELPA